MSFIQKLHARARSSCSLLCIGLDTDVSKVPPAYQQKKYPLFAFNRMIIDATQEYACAYKPNMAFYEANGAKGIEQLEMTVSYLHKHYPTIVTICDAKRADIGSTSEAYAKAIFDELGFDAVTLNPYLGRDALSPFLERKDKGCIIVCKTSNPGSGEFQDQLVSGKPLWQLVAKKVTTTWNTKNNCMLVVGATYPEELAVARNIVGDDMWFLVPGVGKQGGSVEEVMAQGANSKKEGVLINASRSILYAGDKEAIRKEAKKLYEEILRAKNQLTK